jgi:hypothetical protein
MTTVELKITDQERGNQSFVSINNFKMYKEYIIKIHDYGTKEYFLNGKLHREDGPAVEYSSGTKCWYLDGECHRHDGPAIEWADGVQSWYLNGKEYSLEEYLKKINKTPACPACEAKVVEIEGKKYKLTEV